MGKPGPGGCTFLGARRCLPPLGCASTAHVGTTSQDGKQTADRVTKLVPCENRESRWGQGREPRGAVARAHGPRLCLPTCALVRVPGPDGVGHRREAQRNSCVGGASLDREAPEDKGDEVGGDVAPAELRLTPPLHEEDAHTPNEGTKHKEQRGVPAERDSVTKGESATGRRGARAGGSRGGPGGGGLPQHRCSCFPGTFSRTPG